MSGQEISRLRVGVDEQRGELRVPWIHKHRALAELKVMLQRGEIGSAFNARREGSEYVVEYVRIAEPPSRTKWYVGAPLAALGGMIGVGGMIYHARHVIAGGALILLGIFLAACAISAIVAVISSIGSGGSSGHCPGAFHK